MHNRKRSYPNHGKKKAYNKRIKLKKPAPKSIIGVRAARLLTKWDPLLKCIKAITTLWNLFRIIQSMIS